MLQTSGYRYYSMFFYCEGNCFKFGASASSRQDYFSHRCHRRKYYWHHQSVHSQVYYHICGIEKFADDILLLHTFPHKGQIFGRACSILPWSSRNCLVFNHLSQLSPRKMYQTTFLPSNSSFPANYSKSGTCTMKIKFLLGKV